VVVCKFARDHDTLTHIHSADDALLIVWNLSTGEKMQEIQNFFHGAVSAIAWIRSGDTEGGAFVFGCADGTLHIYKQVDNQVSQHIIYF
jgi:WD40 repeat protein